MQRHFGEVPDDTVVFDYDVENPENADVAEPTPAENGRLPPLDDMPINECFDSDNEDGDGAYNPCNCNID